MPHALPHIASLFFGRPLLLTPAAAEAAGAVLLREEPDAEIVANLIASREKREANAFMGTRKRKDGRYSMTPMVGNTAIITIDGKLVNRGAWVGADSGLVSYEGIEAQVRDALADPEVASIMLDANSPGGEGDGVYNLANLIGEANKVKPVTMFVNDMAASAMYWLGSQAGEIVISPTSLVGSIGVVVVHLDRSGELAKKGIKATVITGGAHKADYAPFGPLSDEMIAALQTECDNMRELFAGAVAAGRGARLTKAAALATEARVFTGTDAITAGLADRIATFEQVIKGLNKPRTSAPAARAATKGVKAMAEDRDPGAEAGIPKDQHDKALSTATETATAAERTRVAGILALDEAKGREATAQVCITQGMSIEASKTMLASVPKASSLATRGADDQLGNLNDGEKITAGAAAAGWKKATDAYNTRFASKH